MRDGWCQHDIPTNEPCAACDADEIKACADEVARLTAENKRLAAEVAYLRAHREWGRGVLGMLSGHTWLKDDEWHAAHPEPQPPEGVEP